MPTLWLNPVVALATSEGPDVEARVQAAVLEILRSHACWPAGPAGTVSWAPTGGMVAAPPAEDCVVHFVGSFSSGVAQRLLGSARDSVDPDRLAEFRSLDPPELGATLVRDTATASEVHLAHCRRRLFSLRAHSTRLEGARLSSFALVLAAVAWHEAMHNKVEPAMGAGWDLHADGGGAWAATFMFGPDGGYLGASAPSSENCRLMGLHFARPVPQFVPLPG